MTCTLNEPKLRFLESGITVNIKELSTRKSRGRYSYAKCKLPKSGGEWVANNAIGWEPVEVYINDNLQSRYFYPEESLEISRDSANFKLYGARKILERGAFTNSYGEVQVNDVIHDIVESREDPYDVIEGVKIVDTELIREEKQNTREDIVETLYGPDADADQGGGLGGLGNALLAGTVNTVGHFGAARGMPHNSFQNMEFDDESPESAIMRIEKAFGISSWVDEDGLIVFGLPESIPRNYHAVSGRPSDNNYRMKEYNVTKGSTRITFVRLNGKSGFYGGNLDDEFGADPTEELFPIAEAWVVGEDGGVANGGTLAPDQRRDMWKLKSLEDAALNLLVKASMTHKNGNIVFNGLSSQKSKKLAKMDIGDPIMVPEHISDHCSQEADGGLYSVTEVQHQISMRDGWKVTCEVSEVPQKTNSDSVYYNSTDDEAYKNLKTYKRNQK